ILSPQPEITNLTHENLEEHGINEYEVGDNLGWINITVTNYNTTAVDVNITLGILDYNNQPVSWGPNETYFCGTLQPGNACEKRWDNSTQGYPIPLNAAPGTYNFAWNVTLDWANGDTEVMNSSIRFTIHNLTTSFSSSLEPQEVIQGNNATYNFTITNPWSVNITNLSVWMNCPEDYNITCVCNMSGQQGNSYCMINTVEGGLGGDEWWDLGWFYRKPINLSGTGENLSEYTTNLTIDTQSLISQGKLNPDCSDLRFTFFNDTTPETEAGYWIESGCNTTQTEVWVKVSWIPANGNATLYMYYGNPSAQTGSDFTQAFTLVGESGLVTANDSWTNVSFQNTFPATPVVIASMLTINSGDNNNASARIQDVSTQGFSIKAEESLDLDQIHVNETFGWVAWREGNWDIGGLRTEAGSLMVDESYSTITFSSFPEMPVAFAMVQTFNQDHVHTRQNFSTSSSFDVKLEYSDNSDPSSLTPEKVGWFVIPETSIQNNLTGNLLLQAQDTGDAVRHLWYLVNFSSYQNLPVALVKIATEDGGDNSHERVTGFSNSGLYMKVEEEFGYDGRHTQENMSWFVVNVSQGIYGRPYTQSPPTQGSAGAEEIRVHSGVAEFLVITSNTTPVGDYWINASMNYTNPGNENKTYEFQTPQLLQIRMLGLEITAYNFPSQITRGHSFNLTSYVNNTIADENATDVWLNYTYLPYGWSNQSGNINVFLGNLTPGETGWNNITAHANLSSELGEQTVTLKSSSSNNLMDILHSYITVFADTMVLEPTSNNTDPVQGETVRLSCKLTYDNGTSIPNQNISFYDNQTYLGSNLTNTLGYAYLDHGVSSTAALGVHTLNFTFHGNTSIFVNPSWNQTNITVHDVPKIQNVSAQPQRVGYHYNVTISVNVTDSEGVDTVMVHISPGDIWLTMNNETDPDIYQVNFTDTLEPGSYTYYIFANDSIGFQSTSSDYYFWVASNASLVVEISQTNYSKRSNVTLTGRIKNWWNSSWKYRKPVNITGSNKDLEEHQIKIIINTQELISQGKMNETCEDIRFTNSSSQEMPYWIESGCNTTSTVIWVKTPWIPANQNETIYLYYGNPNVTNTSNRTRVFTYESQPPLYYVVSSFAAGRNLNVSAYENGTQATEGTTNLTLNEQDVGYFSGSNIDQGTLIYSNKPLALRSTGNSVDTASPVSWAGTWFTYACTRGTDVWSVCSPFGTASVSIYEGSSTSPKTQFSVSQGSCYTANTDITDGYEARLESDVPVLVTHHTTQSQDASVVYPASYEVYGISSSDAYLSVLEDNTFVQVYYSSGTNNNYTLSRGGYQSLGGGASQGQGDALHIIANKPVMVIQQADADGSETTVFLPESELNHEYVLPGDVQYVAIACPYPDTNITIYYPDGSIQTQGNCGSNQSPHPNKFWYGDSTTGSGSTVTMRAGTKILATKPIYLYYEYKDSSVTDGDETNIVGYKQARKYWYPEPRIVVLPEEIYLDYAYIYNRGSTDMKGYLLMKVQRYQNGWSDVEVIVNDLGTQTIRETPSSSILNLSAIWDSQGGWNTDRYENGTYRVYAALLNKNGNILWSTDDEYISDSASFEILPPPSIITITNITIYKVTNTSDLYTNSSCLVDYGLNKTFDLYTKNLYRVEIQIKNSPNSEENWSISDASVWHSGLSEGWNVTVNETLKSDWWNESWGYRKRINITNNADGVMEENYTVNITLDTQSLVSQGLLLSSGNDLRIVYWNGSGYEELDRVNTTDFNTTSTVVWFRTKKNISAYGFDDDYWMYFANPSAGQPPQNKSRIYLFYDDFDTNTSDDYTPHVHYYHDGGTQSWTWDTANNVLTPGDDNDCKSLIYAKPLETMQLYLETYNEKTSIDDDAFGVGWVDSDITVHGATVRDCTSGHGVAGFMYMPSSGEPAALTTEDCANFDTDSSGPGKVAVARDQNGKLYSWYNDIPNSQNSYDDSAYTPTNITIISNAMDNGPYYSYFLARKFVYPEPSATLGSSEYKYNQSQIWYTNESENFYGGNWSGGNVTWNTSLDGTVPKNSTARFIYILNTTEVSGTFPVHFMIDDLNFIQEDFSVYNLIETETQPPQLYNNIYGLTPQKINRTQSVKIYAQWNESIAEAYVEFNSTLPTFTTQDISLPDPNPENWTNHTLTTDRYWLLGWHAAKIYAADLNYNWNNSLEYL
ncbi:MAG: hypothetical protein DRP13_02995, partial [Candidatus Aenigmatarchaeota archaeon]